MSKGLSVQKHYDDPWIQKIHAQKTCFPAASNAMLPQKLTSAPRCLGSYTALDVGSESCRKQQHTNNNAQNTLGGVLQS